SEDDRLGDSKLAVHARLAEDLAARRDEPPVAQAADAGDAVAEVSQEFVRPDRLRRDLRLAPALAQVVRALEEDPPRQVRDGRELRAVHGAQDAAVLQPDVGAA